MIGLPLPCDFKRTKTITGARNMHVISPTSTSRQFVCLTSQTVILTSRVLRPTLLLRLARKRNLAAWAATQQPDGQITKTCPSLFRKIFRLTRRANQHYEVRPSHPMRGADRESSRTRGGMRWTRELRLTSVTDADGEDVWSWRPKLAPSLLKQFGGRRWQQSSAHRGERAISRKTTAQGKPDASAEPVCSCALFICAFCTRDRGCSAHPAFPAPSCSSRVAIDTKLGRIAPRERGRTSYRCMAIESASGEITAPGRSIPDPQDHSSFFLGCDDDDVRRRAEVNWLNQFAPPIWKCSLPPLETMSDVHESCKGCFRSPQASRRKEFHAECTAHGKFSRPSAFGYPGAGTGNHGARSGDRSRAPDPTRSGGKAAIDRHFPGARASKPWRARDRHAGSDRDPGSVLQDRRFVWLDHHDRHGSRRLRSGCSQGTLRADLRWGSRRKLCRQPRAWRNGRSARWRLAGQRTLGVCQRLPACRLDDRPVCHVGRRKTAARTV